MRPICIQCKHVLESRAIWPRCTRYGLATETFDDVVRGPRSTTKYKLCDDLRKEGGECAPEGLGFEAQEAVSNTGLFLVFGILLVAAIIGSILTEIPQ